MYNFKKCLKFLILIGLLITASVMFLSCTNGQDGKDGLNGRDGENGKDGERWYCGTVDIVNGSFVNDVEFSAVNGDFYIDTNNYILYQLKNNSWTVLMEDFGKPGSTQTIKGIDGATWYSCVGTPADTSTIGKDGDFYLNSFNYDIYKKTAGVWTLVGNIKGADGVNGKDGKDGSTVETFNGTVLRTGTFVNKTPLTTTIALSSSNNYILTMDTTVAVPYDECEFKVKVNDNYIVKFYSSNTHIKLDTESEWLENGDSYKIPAGHIYMRVAITHKDNISGNITPVLAENISSVGLELIYNNNHNIIELNDEALRYIDLYRGYFANSAATKDSDKYAVITHATDVHGDITRLDNLLTFADYIGADLNLFTGDMTAYDKSTGWSAVIETFLSHKTKSVVATGNHDLYGSLPGLSADQMIYEEIYKKIFDAYGIVGEVINGQPSTWYYQDDTAHKIRAISLNAYEMLGSSGAGNIHYNQRQINFLINALNSMPEGYTCLLFYHAPEVQIDKASTPDNTFFNDLFLYTDVCYHDYSGCIIGDIVDAFIEKSNLSKTYAQANTYDIDGLTKKSSISVEADFTKAKGTFAAHLTGHLHQEAVCYVPGTRYKQVMLNAPCVTANEGNKGGYIYASDSLDVPRYKDGVTQDAFNTYIIDTDKQEIHIVRVGSNLTYDLQERKHMSISYKNEIVSYSYIEVNISTDASDWQNYGVGETGPSSANTMRLSIKSPLNVPAGKKVKITFNPTDGYYYQFAIRSGDDGTTYPNNQYWYSSGEEVTVLGTKTMYIILRKVNYAEPDDSDFFTVVISPSDLSNMNMKAYFYEKS